MLPHNKKNILKENLKKILIIKYIYSNIIKKSIFQNRTLNLKIRSIAHLSIKKSKTNKNKLINTCLLTGRKKGISKSLHLSRHQLNIFSKSINLQNFKINS
jgi:ribosomal protein S14